MTGTALFNQSWVKKERSSFKDLMTESFRSMPEGMTTRDIQAHFQEVYGVEVSPTFVSQVTNSVMEEVTAWQSRPLNEVYPIVYLDALVVRSRNASMVQNMSVYLALEVGQVNSLCLGAAFDENHRPPHEKTWRGTTARK
jgi:transposase-like protein